MSGNVLASNNGIENDKTPPTISYSLNGGDYTETMTVVIKVSDEESGIKRFGVNVYKDGVKDTARSKATITDTTSYKVNLGGDGVWRIETYAFDKAGNKNLGNPVTKAGWYYQIYTIDTTLPYKDDKEPPVISYSLDEGEYEGSKTVNITVTDKDSGINRFGVNVYKNGKKDSKKSDSWITDKTSYNVKLNSNGEWKIEVYAFDKAGNKNVGDSLTKAGWERKIYIIKDLEESSVPEKEIDTTSPEIKYSIQGGEFYKNQTVKITVTDSQSGVERFGVNVYKDGEKDNKKSKATITNKKSFNVKLNGEGTWRIETYAFDKAGNKNSGDSLNNSGWYTQTYVIDESLKYKDDKTAPTITYSIPGGEFDKTQTIKVKVSDVGSGIKSFGVNVYKNGVKDEKRSKATITNKKSYSVNLGGEGVWRIETYAFDKAGNKNSGDSLNNAGWYTQTYTIDTIRGKNNIYFIKLNQGAGDAILLESNGHFGLVDTGYSQDSANTIEYIKSKGVKKLDFLLITHFHGDHMGAAKEVLKNIKVNKLYIKTFKMGADSTESGQKIYESIIKLAKRNSTKVIYTDKIKDDTYSFSMEDMKFKLYNIKTFNDADKNAESIIAYITIGNTKSVLTGDANWLNEELLNNIASEIGYNVNLYKMPHHATDGAARAKAFNPNNIVITSTEDKSQEHKMEIYPDAKRYFSNETENALVARYSIMDVTFTEE